MEWRQPVKVIPIITFTRWRGEEYKEHFSWRLSEIRTFLLHHSFLVLVLSSLHAFFSTGLEKCLSGENEINAFCLFNYYKFLPPSTATLYDQEIDKYYACYHNSTQKAVPFMSRLKIILFSFYWSKVTELPGKRAWIYYGYHYHYEYHF